MTETVDNTLLLLLFLNVALYIGNTSSILTNANLYLHNEWWYQIDELQEVPYVVKMVLIYLQCNYLKNMNN